MRRDTRPSPAPAMRHPVRSVLAGWVLALPLVAAGLSVPATATAAVGAPSSPPVASVSVSAPSATPSTAAARSSDPSVTGIGSPRTGGGVLAPSRPAAARATLIRQRNAAKALAALPVPGLRVAAAAPPASVDLRTSKDSQGNALLPPVRSQGPISGCLPWSVAHTMMGYYAARDGDTGAPYAPLYLYLMNTKKAPKTGTNPEAVLAYAKSSGVDTQADYFQGYYTYKVKPTRAQKAFAANFRVTDWTRLWAGYNTGGSAEAAARKELIQTALAAGNPVSMGLDAYSSFSQFTGSGVYTTHSGTNSGGHMVTAVGYDADSVIIRNSWGTAWGNQGDARIGWDLVTNRISGAYTITGVTTPAPGSAAANPKATNLKLSVKKGTASGGTAVSITGSNLVGATAVNVGETAVELDSGDVVTTNGTTTVTVSTPKGVAGKALVTVTNAGGTSDVTSKTKFTYTAVLPVIASENGMSTDKAASEGGTEITITGEYLSNGKVIIEKRTVPKKLITAASDTSITFSALPHLAGTVDVTVKTKGGTVVAGQLTYAPEDPPVISSLSANTASISVKNQITVTGSSLTQVKKAYIGTKSVPFTRISNTQLVLRLPKARSAITGDVQLKAKWSTSATSEATAFTWS